jgi:hypothetical protein
MSVALRKAQFDKKYNKYTEQKQSEMAPHKRCTTYDLATLHNALGIDKNASVRRNGKHDLTIAILHLRVNGQTVVCKVAY